MPNDSKKIIKTTKYGFILPLISIATIPFLWNMVLSSNPPIQEYLFLMFFTIVAILLVALFSSLTTKITKTNLEIYFGPFFLKRVIPLKEIQMVKAAKISWIRSFGVSLMKKGVVYSLHGGEGTELVLTKGFRVQIGQNIVDQLKNRLTLSENN